jgi:3-oxoacyl-[acyl-carrier protein] reductase
MEQRTGRIAIVTGASRGIGAAVAERLARDGFTVVINYSGDAAPAEALVRKIEDKGGRALAAKADVSDAQAVRGMFDAAEAAFGGVDVLVNNAGIMPLSTIADTGDATFERLIDVNLKGTFNTLREAARRLRNGGRIISFSSSVVALLQPTYGVYAATKAAVEAMTSVLAKELHGRAISVNAVAPGPTATGLFLNGKPQEVLDRLAKLAPLERLGEPEDIAATVAFLAGPDGGWINGQTLRANGRDHLTSSPEYPARCRHHPVTGRINVMKQVIVITGASTGFGALAARALVQAGHTVYATMRETTGRNAPQVAEAEHYAAEHGVDLRTVELDVAAAESVEAGIAKLIADTGRLDVVIHNAGHMSFGPAEAFTPEQFAELFDVNVLSTQRVNRAALPQLRKQGRGLVIWVSSSTARGGTPPYLSPYFAAKAAMDSLAVSHAAELARWGIETAIIVPEAFHQGHQPLRPLRLARGQGIVNLNRGGILLPSVARRFGAESPWHL